MAGDEPEAKRPRIVVRRGRGTFEGDSAGGARLAARENGTPRRTLDREPRNVGATPAVGRVAAAGTSPKRVQALLPKPVARSAATEPPKAAVKADLVRAVPKAEAALKPERKAVEKPEPKAATAPKRDAPAAALASAGVAAKGQVVVTFDVGGTLFRVSRNLIRAKHFTHLAQLLTDAGNPSEPIFVDMAPERFSYILDWYRYGEMNVPRSVPLAALLRDAEHLNLPSELIVNGVIRSTVPNVAHKVGRELLETVTSRWAGFATFFSRLLDDIREHFRKVGDESHQAPGGEEEELAEGYDFRPFVVPLYGDSGWVDEQNLNSAQRARALALKLEERGFVCEFTETELIVALPLRLQGESMHGEPEGDEEGEGEGPFDGDEGAEAAAG